MHRILTTFFSDRILCRVIQTLPFPKQTGTQNTCTTTDEQEMLDFLNDENLICLG